MKTRIRCLHDGEEKDALVKCLENAGRMTRLSTEQALAVITYFFEEVADQICLGRAVPFPGFGMWAPVLEERPIKVKRHNMGFAYCTPGWSPSRGFREQVKTCAPTRRHGKEVLRNHVRNNTRTGYTGKRVHSTMQELRDSITRQLEGGV
jgi:nucleoid DNA-binding protein